MNDQQDLQATPWHRSLMIAALLLVSLVGCALLSYLVLDRPVFSWLIRHPDAWNGHPASKAFALLGKAWVLIWLLLVWFSITARLRPLRVAFLALLLV